MEPTTTTPVEAPMTDAELLDWLDARGVTGRDLPILVVENRGKTRTQTDDEYDRVCGRMA